MADNNNSGMIVETVADGVLLLDLRQSVDYIVSEIPGGGGGGGTEGEVFTKKEKQKLSGIEDKAQVNVQADWNTTDASAGSFIKNKPDLTKYDASIGTINTKITGIDSSINALKTSLAKTDASVGRLYTYADVIDASVSGIMTKQTAQDASISSLISKTEGIDASVGTLYRLADVLEETLGGINTKIGGIDSSIAGLAERTTAIDASILNLRFADSSINESLRQLDEHADQLDSSIAEISGRQDSADASIAELTEKVGSGDLIVDQVSLTKTSHPYLYETYFASYNQDKAYEYCSHSSTIGACTGVRSGNFYGRNFDFIYNETVTFVVKTPHTNHTYATMGISAGMPALTKAIVEDAYAGNKHPQQMDVIPWIMLDGINECGVVTSINVVPQDYEVSTPTNPLVETRDTIYDQMLVRYILDNFSTARAAVEYIRDYVCVKTSPSTDKMGYDIHCMVADPNETYVIEFIDGDVKIISEPQVMTNFYLYGMQTKENGAVYTNLDAKYGVLPTVDGGITKDGSGLERYNIAIARIEEAATKIGMRSLMNDLKYTQAYTLDNENLNAFWFSEFVGGPYTVDTPADDPDYNALIDHYQEVFENRSSTPGDPTYGTWWTQHSSVYDIANRTLNLVVHEELDTEYNYEFDYLSKPQVDAGLKALADKIAQIESGDAIYLTELPDNTTMEVAVGGIPANTTAAQLRNKTFTELFDMLLFPTVNPVFTDPSITSFSLVGYNDVQEVGSDAPAAANFSYGFSRGEIRVGQTFQNYRSGAETSHVIYVGTKTSELPDKISLGDNIYTLEVAYAGGPQPLDSRGNEVGTPLIAGCVTQNKVISGVLPAFYGTTKDASVDSDTIMSLNKYIGNKAPLVVYGPIDEAYVIFAVPSSWSVSRVMDNSSYTISGSYDIIEDFKLTVNDAEYDYTVWKKKILNTIEDTNYRETIV